MITSSKTPASGPNLQPANCDIQQTESELKPKKKKKKKAKTSEGQEGNNISGEAASLINKGDSLMTPVEQSVVEKKSKKKPKEPKEPKEPKTPKTLKTPKTPKEPKEKKVKTATPKPKSSKKPRYAKSEPPVAFRNHNYGFICIV